MDHGECILHWKFEKNENGDEIVKQTDTDGITYHLKNKEEGKYYEIQEDTLQNYNISFEVKIEKTLKENDFTNQLTKTQKKQLTEIFENRVFSSFPSCSHFPPYKIEEIVAFEIEYGVELPLELKCYLTCVSSGIYKDHLYYQQVLLKKYNELGDLSVRMMPTIQKDTDYYLDKCECEENECVCNLDNQTQTFTLRHIGCGYTNLLIIDKSEFNGQVWEEKFDGGGTFHKTHNSFFEYVLDFD